MFMVKNIEKSMTEETRPVSIWLSLLNSDDKKITWRLFADLERNESFGIEKS